jgi:monoterpene epsilon-lactone hydrolase
MLSKQTELVRDMIKSIVSSGLQPGLSIEARRKFFETTMAPLGLLADTQIEKINVISIPAEWVSAPGAQPERVLLYLHGGGYCIGSCNTHRDLAARLSQVTGARALSLDYRLAPEHPFPAAVEDATTAFRWLLNEGIPSEHIIIGGDSAGAGLTLATLLSLRDAGERLPATAVFLSGWMDMTCSGESHNICADMDIMVKKDDLKQWREWYIGHVDPPPLLSSPLHGDLRGLPPMIIHVGSDETLRDDSKLLAKQAHAAGVEAKLEIWDGMWHVFQQAAVLGVPESQAALDQIGEFVRKHI